MNNNNNNTIIIKTRIVFNPISNKKNIANLTV